MKAFEARLALELADDMVEIPDGMQMGPTDTALCVKALRAYGRRRAKTRASILSAVALAPLMGIFLSIDFNDSGTSTWRDLASGKNPFSYEEAKADQVNISQFVELTRAYNSIK